VRSFRVTRKAQETKQKKLLKGNTETTESAITELTEHPESAQCASLPNKNTRLPQKKTRDATDETIPSIAKKPQAPNGEKRST
jgi:hypothetical protein